MRRKRHQFMCALAVSAAALLGSPVAKAQYGGGPPASVIFYSARDGNGKPQVYVMDPDGNNQARVFRDTVQQPEPDCRWRDACSEQSNRQSESAGSRPAVHPHPEREQFRSQFGADPD